MGLPLSAQAATKPNVVILYIDDMGIGDVGCYGGKFVPTPNIDKLAEDGLKFEQYYSAAPVSSASRVGLTTGRYPLSQGVTTFLSSRAKNRGCEQLDYLDAKAQSMARAFQSAGYATAHIGKWHMGGGRDVDDAPSIKDYGFDEYISTWESPDPDPIITAGNSTWSPKDSVKRWERTRYFVDKSIDFAKRNSDKPFFLNVWLNDMHTPWVPQNLADAAKSDWVTEPAFKPVLREMDKQLGRFIGALDEMGLSENTIVIFSSDNGPSPSFESLRSAKLRGTKNSLYEGGIRMPFIVKYPKAIKAGRINESSVVCAVDLYPSLCSMAGIATEPNYKGDGQDYSDVLLGKKETIRESDLMWDFGRNSEFKFPDNPYDKSPHLAIRRGKWKLLTNGDGSDVQLYDMDKDKFETKNIATSQPELVKELTAKVCLWYKDYRGRGILEGSVIDEEALAKLKADKKKRHAARVAQGKATHANEKK